MEIKMNKTVIIVSAVVGSLGLLSAVLGFAAEGANPYNPSPGLGICAAIFLLAAQITVSVAGGCCGCCKPRDIPSETNPTAGIVCAVVSWMLAVIALALFFRGAALNGIGYYQIGVFAGAGVLTLAATALGITSFIMLRPPPADATATGAATGATNTPGAQPSPVVIMVSQPVQSQPTVAAGAQNKPGEQPPPSKVTVVQPQFPPAEVAGAHDKPVEPPQPAEVAISHSLAAAASEPKKPDEQPFAGDTMGQPQLPLPQVYVVQVQPQPQPQSLCPVQPQVCVDIPAPPTTPPLQVNGQEKLSTVIRNEATKAGIKLVGRAVDQVLFSDSTSTPTTMAADILLSMVTGSTGGDVGATGSGDAAC
ncbi:uncharacterized protein LOC133929896 [Phragmites australis]|uniref:uncharacterized protein LOC133929896 n=1 Tax=Phragmites australis TaxID=29695 RepID=UPI002D788672|nr:uncharacterized protein LOC133929896 [Phragmites australis]